MMLSQPAPQPSSSAVTACLLMPFAERLLGAAVFDFNGLPREYFVNREEKEDVRWVQVIFQALGLQSLLASSLQLEGFRHVVIDSSDCFAVVVRHKSGYISLLLQREGTNPLSRSVIQWAHELEPHLLREDPRFKAV